MRRAVAEATHRNAILRQRIHERTVSVCTNPSIVFRLRMRAQLDVPIGTADMMAVIPQIVETTS